MRRVVVALAVVVSVASVLRVARADQRSFAAGSLIIPMAWVIDPAKTWHAAPCNVAGNLCAWDCAVEGSGVKCEYPTASPDFFTS